MKPENIVQITGCIEALFVGISLGLTMYVMYSPNSAANVAVGLGLIVYAIRMPKIK